MNLGLSMPRYVPMLYINRQKYQLKAKQQSCNYGLGHLACLEITVWSVDYNGRLCLKII